MQERKEQNTFRELKKGSGKTDFVSNDYLGMAREEEVFHGALSILESMGLMRNGSTGSRLLSGNTELHERTEISLARLYGSESALIFNSGYDANLGFFSSVPQRDDVVLFDEYVHASMRDGIRMGLGRSYKYKHNDLEDLRQILRRIRPEGDRAVQCYIATEAVFSMDGDQPDLPSLLDLCSEFGCRLVLDEAHKLKEWWENSTGNRMGELLDQMAFARIVTFGKGMGVQGAAVLGSEELRSYLINFARSFIYSTALPPMSIASVLYVCDHMSKDTLRERNERLRSHISVFLEELKTRGLKERFIPSTSAIHSCIIPGNNTVKQVTDLLNKSGFDVRPILAPTVPAGKERIRFCLHSFNAVEEIKEVLSILAHALEEIVHA